MLATDIVVYVLAALRDSFWFQPLDNFDKCKVINSAKISNIEQAFILHSQISIIQNNIYS